LLARRLVSHSWQASTLSVIYDAYERKIMDDAMESDKAQSLSRTYLADVMRYLMLVKFQ